MPLANGSLSGLILFPAQLLGAIVAAALIDCMIPGPIGAVRTTLAPDMSVTQGVFFEMFLTCELVFTVLMLAAEKTKATFMAPVGIGLALFAAEIAGVYYTGGSLNPARSFGPCVAAVSFEGYHWIYWYVLIGVPRMHLRSLIREKGWAVFGCACECGLLPLRQIPQLRGGKSRTRLCGQRGLNDRRVGPVMEAKDGSWHCKHEGWNNI